MFRGTQGFDGIKIGIAAAGLCREKEYQYSNVKGDYWKPAVLIDSLGNISLD
jgi:hypothetical protein